jgi:predicted DNA-binding WGR domain protein
VVERAAGLKSLAREGRRAIPDPTPPGAAPDRPGAGDLRFYSLMIERDLFGTVRLVRNRGRIGSQGQELVEIHADEVEAGHALEALAASKRRRGYRDL